MSCQDYQSRIANFLKSKLTQSDEAEMVGHLAKCVECRFVYQKIRQQLENNEKGTLKDFHPSK